MKLSECREAYYELSGKASEVSRNLAFAGIALIWIFKEDQVNKVPGPLIFPALLFVIALALDLLHYTYGAAVWGIRQRHEEKKLKDLSQDREFSVSRFWNWPTNLFYLGKILAVVCGYALVTRYIGSLWLIKWRI